MPNYLKVIEINVISGMKGKIQAGRIIWENAARANSSRARIRLGLNQTSSCKEAYRVGCRDNITYVWYYLLGGKLNENIMAQATLNTFSVDDISSDTQELQDNNMKINFNKESPLTRAEVETEAYILNNYPFELSAEYKFIMAESISDDLKQIKLKLVKDAYIKTMQDVLISSMNL